MPLFELTKDDLLPVDEVTLISQGIKERSDLQKIFKKQIEKILPDTFVLAEEYSDWEDSRRSIDLLCLDKKANLLVIELKRTEDGGHMELQAIRYAAMISSMRFSDAVRAHASFLKSNGDDPEKAELAILEFLDWEKLEGNEFAQEVGIVLISNNFSKEITTSVMWLNDNYQLDIRCLRLQSYRIQDKLLLDIEQIVPLPEATPYQIQIRRKAVEEREARSGSSDWSRYVLSVANKELDDLNKRQLFLHTIRSLVQHGVSIEEIEKQIPARKLIGIEGKLSENDFQSRLSKMTLSNGNYYNLRRFFVGGDELFFAEGKTWALSNQWSIDWMPMLDKLITDHPSAQISYKKII